LLTGISPGPELILVAHQITLHTVSKVHHDSEHGIICWSGSCGTR